MEVQSDHTGDMENLKLATETDRFGFVLGNGITVGDGPSPVLVRHREVKWLSIISNWDDISQRRSSKVKGQCQKGIPASLRAKCWPMLCGATRRMSQNPNLYKTLDESPASQSWVDVIERDTDRQFPFHEMFLSKDGLGQRELFRVLKIYTQFRPDEGYCQAQGPVAAVLLMNMPAEEAFWCLAQISEIYLPGYYSPLLEGVLFDAGMLPWVLKRACPAAHRHLQRQGVEPLMFATDWLMCLYTRHLPFNTLLRVWDLFFCYGVRVLFQVAVVLVRRVLGRGDQREQCDGQMETLERLRGVKDYLKPEDSDIFIQEVCSVSLSERDLQRRAERELEKWRKERPNSTYDPRHRCHGYLMACERVKEMEECKERQEKVKGNLSLPLVHRSASSLSPSLLRKRWKKRGSRLSLGSQCEEESADVQRGFEVEKRKSSTSSVNGAQRCAEESHHNTITPNSCHSELERPSTSASGAGTTSRGSEQFQEHRHLEEDTPAPEPAPTSESESDGPAQRSGQEMGKTDCNIEKEKGVQEMHTEDEESRTVKDEQTEEAEEDVQHGDRVRDTAKSDSEAQLITEDSDTVVEAEEIEAQAVDEEAGGIQVMQEEESKVKITDEEIQPENIEEELMVSVTIKNKEIQLEDTQEGPMVSAQETSEREVEVVEDVEQQETRVVTDIQEEPTSEDQQGEIVSQAEHKDEKHDHLDSDDVQMSVGQNEWEGQEQNEVTGTESRRPDNDYDLHKGEQTESLPMQLIRSRQSVVEEEEVETTPPKETTNDDDKCLNSDLTHPQPQCSLNTGISPETQSPETDDGPSIMEGDQASFSTLHDTVTLTDSKVLTATPVSESQEQPQEMEVKTEAEGALEGHPERRAQTETAGHLEEMEEMRTEGVQEEASVNTQPPTTSTGSCSASSGRPGLQTDRSAFIVTESVVDDGGEHTLTEQLTPPPPPPPPPHVQSVSHSATQDTLDDTSTTQNAVQLHQKLECSRPHRSQDEVDAGETKDHTETVVDKREARPDVDSVGKPPDSVEETTSDLDPLTVSRSDLHKSQGDSEPEKAEMCVKGEHICDQEQAVTSCPFGGLNSKTQDGIEKDHVAPLNIPHTEPTKEGILGPVTEGTMGTDTEGTMGTDKETTMETVEEGTMGTDTEGTMGTDTEGTMGTDTETTMGTDTEGTMGTDTEGTMGTDKETTMETVEEGTMGTDPEKTMETGTEGTMGKAPEGSMTAEPPLSTCAPVHRRRSSTSSRNSYPTVLSKDIFISPKETTQHDYTPAQPSQTDTQQTPTSPSDLELETPTTLPASHSSNPSQTQKQTLSPADKRTKQTDGSKRIGIFQRLRGAKGSNTSTPKITIPKILIQDFSEEAEEDEKLTSKERRRRKREKEKKEKEEERLRKKQEKEMEKERDRERKKPQTRGKSFQLPSSPMRGKDGTIRRSDSQTVVSRRNSTPLSENYF
ncbi:apoptotic chromatin condensation inducer in the nucleus [Engraulis encrasicolus]|uniref:apoptotic chromatin condensation inducer in the nucleus n=1 Tax=Engraulis encrasicolus TaxID=184585 RepID=UPI002FD4F20C